MVTLSYASYTVSKEGNCRTTRLAQAFSSLPLTKDMSTPPTNRNARRVIGTSGEGETSSPLLLLVWAQLQL